MILLGSVTFNVAVIQSEQKLPDSIYELMDGFIILLEFKLRGFTFVNASGGIPIPKVSHDNECPHAAASSSVLYASSKQAIKKAENK
jgi:hypothetical protein